VGFSFGLGGPRSVSCQSLRGGPHLKSHELRDNLTGRSWDGHYSDSWVIGGNYGAEQYQQDAEVGALVGVTAIGDHSWHHPGWVATVSACSAVEVGD